MESRKIAEFIFQCRNEKKMTQSDLAERIGVSVQSISKWETGKAVPSFEHLNELCTVFDLTLTELLNGEKIESQDAPFSVFLIITTGKESMIRRLFV